MPKKKEPEITLPSLDDLFSSQQTREDANLSKIRDIPISEIDDFPNHPFKVKDDEDMLALADSIRERGIITPAKVREKEDGRYELIAGHRRKRASILAGIDTLPCEITELDRDEAIIMMVDSNLQRTKILPSEKAFSYKMRLEAMNRQGMRSDLTSDPLGPKLRSNTMLAKEIKESETQIKRYIRLTELIPEILEIVDEGRIGLRPAVEISYFPKELQQSLFDTVEAEVCTPSHAQTLRMRDILKEGRLTPDSIYAIMQEEKPNQKERIVLHGSRVRSLIPGTIPPAKREEYVIKALEFYSRHREKESQAR